MMEPKNILHDKEFPNVQYIPATIDSIHNPFRAENGRRLRVAAYCRVSTDNEEQLTSYTKQKEYYTDLIINHEGWELVNIYADEGISGTSTKKRTEFNRMIQDARHGKIDMIITKSISRLSRNTEDTLKYTRELRLLSPPVEIFFEKEGIKTFDFSSDFILTLFAAFAQAESRSISDNVRWSIQKNFQNGKPTINLNRMLGYDMGENGEWIINEEQAAIVREIYNMYLCGVSAHRIAGILNQNHLYTVNNKWFAKTVIDILRNEKFAGDLEMQKSVTVDMLSHTSKKNEGLAPKYYISDHHTPIIEHHTWNKVQSLLRKNTYEETRVKSRDRVAVLSNLRCGVCSHTYNRYRYTKNVKSKTNSEYACYFAYPLLKCMRNSINTENTDKLKKGMKRCDSEYLHECAIEQSFMEKLYEIRLDIMQNMNRAKVSEEFYKVCIAKAKEDDSIYYRDYMTIVNNIASVQDTLEQTISHQTELSGMLGENDIFKELIEEYQEQLVELENRKKLAIIRIVDSDEYKPIFDYFLTSILSLPNTDSSGNTLNIQNGNMLKYNDLLPFNKAMYLSFIESGTVYGDTISYKTKFGVTFKTTGNMRKPEDFIGFRKYDGNGDSIIITEAYQVVGTKLQYRLKKQRKAPIKHNAIA